MDQVKFAWRHVQLASLFIMRLSMVSSILIVNLARAIV